MQARLASEITETLSVVSSMTCMKKFTLSLEQDGIVLGADTRATEGTIVADKNCSKIHYISQNIQYVEV